MRRRFARGRRHVPGYMNKLEAAYASHLDAQRAAGRIRSYAFEAVKFKLADATYYTPDFLVVMADDVVEIHETKGFWQDDARVKIKVAAAQFPYFRFKAFRQRPKKEGGGWIEERFGVEDA